MEVGSTTNEMGFTCIQGCHGVIDAFCKGGILYRDDACLVDVFSSGREHGWDKGDIVIGVGVDAHEEEALGMVLLCEVTFHGCHF